jgi:glycosyltransferase involved in cell wall biosynthesis
MIKVLGLALYGPLAASNRYRLGQYVVGLRGLGIDLQIRHLLGDDYLRARFRGSELPIASMLKAGFERLVDLFHQSDYDLIMLQCELIPFMPGWIERALIRKPYIYDFDDAFYLKYRSRRMGVFKRLIGGKFDTVMGGAAAVTAGNNVLTDYSKRFNNNTHHLATVVDAKRYLPYISNRGTPFFTIGWIGSPTTAPYLADLIAPLSALGQEGAVKFIVIGGSAPKIPNVSVVEIDWHEHTEVDLINSFDVGVMPLPNDDWARGKCAFKLIQYMACAVPVVASPVGANVDVVSTECGLLASSHHEWLEALRLLRDRPVTRGKMGDAGRARVEQHYSLQQNLPLLAGVMREVASRQ